MFILSIFLCFLILCFPLNKINSYSSEKNPNISSKSLLRKLDSIISMCFSPVLCFFSVFSELEKLMCGRYLRAAKLNPENAKRCS